MPDHAETPRPKRRIRYAGKNPRRFEEKYKEHNPAKYPDTIAKVVASGKTPAGAHRPICVAEILEALNPKPGEVAIDATLGFGGHAGEILRRIRPGGKLIGLDVDPIELPKTEARLRAAGIGENEFIIANSNFAGLPKVLAKLEIAGADIVLADLGVSSMQYDRPERGFSFKHEGPLDMRLNPGRGRPASALLVTLSAEKLAKLLAENSDEPHAMKIANAICSRPVPRTTIELASIIRESLGGVGNDEIDLSVRRVFQALRMAVNEEMSALEAFLRILPNCLAPRGRAAILTFHSGEDRRVKHSFKELRMAGIFSAISEEVIRPGAEEIRSNPRAGSAKLRWAIKA